MLDSSDFDPLSFLFFRNCLAKTAFELKEIRNPAYHYLIA